MSIQRTSVLVPLSPKPSDTTSTSGLLNPLSGRSLSSTPSPIATPSLSRNLSTLGTSTLSPVLSPLPSTNGNNLPLINLGAPPSPIVSNAEANIRSSLASLSAMPPSPLPVSLDSVAPVQVPPSPAINNAEANIRSSLASLSAMPPSPLPSTLPGTPEANIRSSLAALSTMPPSPSINNLPTSLPSSPTLGSLPGFSVEKPISLPPIPATGTLTSVPDANLKPLVVETTVIDAESPSTASFGDFGGMLENTDVEEMLVESGYLPVDKVITKDDNGNLMCQYIKASDATGRSAFVDLDREGFVSVDPKDITMTKSSKASVVPYSVKMGTYECASSDVCGVAFECDNEICTMKRTDDSLAPTETTFSHTRLGLQSHAHKHHGILESHPIAYPIISLSDIINNPFGVECSVRDSHNRMRNVSFKQANNDTNRLVEATQELNKEVNRFDKNQAYISKTLSNTINQLENIHEQYKKSPPTSDLEKQKLRSVHFNLRKRNDLVVDHLKLAESINQRIDRIHELVGELKSLNDYSEKLFVGLEGVYNE